MYSPWDVFFYITSDFFILSKKSSKYPTRAHTTWHSNVGSVGRGKVSYANETAKALQLDTLRCSSRRSSLREMSSREVSKAKKKSTCIHFNLMRAMDIIKVIWHTPLKSGLRSCRQKHMGLFIMGQITMSCVQKRQCLVSSSSFAVYDSS